MANAGNEAILSFLRERAESAGPTRLAIAKVMVTGPGSAGKTCLVERLLGGNFLSDSAQTNGVAVKPWVEKDSAGGSTGLQLRYYDFGGQEIYATSHQLFLRTRAVFLVVWNPRTSSSREAGYEGYLRDVLDANPRAKLLFVCTRQDERTEPASQDQRTRLRQAHGDQVHGFYHVSSRTEAGIDELRRAIVEAANSLEHMDEQVPATYFALQAALQRRREAPNPPLTISRDAWHAEATAAGFTDRERALRALELFHAMGEVLRLPSKSPAAEAVVLAPQRLADLLARVISANQESSGNTKQGLLPHHRLGVIWPGLTADVRSSVLELIHECNLGYPVETEGESVIGATLIPAMLPDLNERAMGILDALRTANPDLAPMPSLSITLSSFTERLSAQLHVRLRRLVTVGGWWRSGCVVAAGCDEEDVSVLWDNAGTNGLLFFGRVSWDAQTRVVRVEGHGDRYMLQQRVLRGLRGALEGFPGISVADLALQCACGGPRVWHVPEMRAATRNGDELVCSRKKSCGRRVQPADVVNWLGTVSTVDQAAEEEEEEKEEKEEEEESKADEAGPAAGGASPPRRASNDAAAPVRRIIEYLRGKLSGGPAVPARELQDAFLGCYSALVQAGRDVGAALRPGIEVQTLWLLYACGSDGAELAAYPLCPRLRGRWVVLAPARVVVPAESCVTASEEQRALSNVVTQVVTALSVVNPNREALAGVLWACDDAEVANHIRYQSDVLFVPAEHPEHPGLWVHREDYPVFAAERMMTATGAGVQAVRDAIRSDA